MQRDRGSETEFGHNSNLIRALRTPQSEERQRAASAATHDNNSTLR